MSEKLFTPHHINARREDLEGNEGIGRYVFLPGSDGRAKRIAERFEEFRVVPHPRGHNVYLGRLPSGGRSIDVAAVSTGMGCPSVDIIVNELYRLGAQRFLRVGTAGSLQPARIPAGHVVIATSGVRDESTSPRYVPMEVPAVASFEMVMAAKRAVAEHQLDARVHFGAVHSKDSLYAREFGAGPMAAANHAYMDVLRRAGILASEMESSHLFILTPLFDFERSKKGRGPQYRVLAGAVLGIVGDELPFASKEVETMTTDDAIDIASATIKHLAALDLEASAP